MGGGLPVGEQSRRCLQVLPSLETGGAELVAVWLAARFGMAGQESSVFALASGSLEPVLSARRIGTTVSSAPAWLKLRPGKVLRRLVGGPRHEGAGTMAAEQWGVFTHRLAYDARTLADVLRRNCISTVHFHVLSTLPLAKVAKRHACRVVYTHHNTLSERHQPADIRFLKTVLDNVDQVVCVSAASADDFAMTTGVDRSTLRVITNPTLVQPPRKDPNGIMQITRFGTASNLGPVKRIDLLLAAWYELLQRPATPRNLQLQLAGGSEVDVQKWRQHAERLGIGAQVSFSGRLSADEMPAFYEQLDCLVICSDTEASPLQAIEAMCGGVPVIATNIPALSETLGDAAIYFKAGDAPALAQAMASLAVGPAAAAALSEHGRTRWEVSYHPDLVATQYREALAL